MQGWVIEQWQITAWGPERSKGRFTEKGELETRSVMHSHHNCPISFCCWCCFLVVFVCEITAFRNLATCRVTEGSVSCKSSAACDSTGLPTKRSKAGPRNLVLAMLCKGQLNIICGRDSTVFPSHSHSGDTKPLENLWLSRFDGKTLNLARINASRCGTDERDDIYDGRPSGGVIPWYLGEQTPPPLERLCWFSMSANLCI